MVRLLKVWRRDFACRDAVALVTDYLEGALSPRDVARLERHLADCADCGEYLLQIRRTIDVLGSVEPEDLAPAARDAMVELLLKFRDEQDEQSQDGDNP